MRLSWSRRRCVELPTTTIYFSHPLRDCIGPMGSACHPIWRVSPNSFLVPAPSPQLVVIRKQDPEARAFLACYPHTRAHYLIDDDIWSGISDPALPECYRARLLDLARETAAPLLSQADCVYVTSKALQERIPRETSLIQPALTAPAASLEHHDETPLTVLFAGTRSHREDLASIAAPLARFLQNRPDCTFETFLGRHAPRELRLPNARHHAPLAWDEYRHVLRSRRFHIGLAPARPTAFNTARSVSKMLEFASFGAAPVYGEGVPFRHLASGSGAAFTAEEFGGDWLALLESLHQDRTSLRRIASANQVLAARLGDPQALRSFWRHELGLDTASTETRRAA